MRRAGPTRRTRKTTPPKFLNPPTQKNRGARYSWSVDGPGRTRGCGWTLTRRQRRQTLAGQAAWFVAPDSAGDGSPALERLVATSQARSFRQMPQPNQPAALPSLNYVRGDVIIITMKLPPLEGVDRVDVKGQVEGVQLEPAPVSAVPPPSPEQEDG